MRKLSRVAYWSDTTHRMITCFGWRTGVSLALATRRPPGVKRVSTGGSPPMLARVGEYESDINAFIQVWHDADYELPPAVRPRWIIDAGANVGYSTRWFAERHPEATVIAIEPDPGNLAVLRLNTQGLSNVIIEEAALSDLEGTAELFDVDQGPWAMRVGEAAGGAGQVVGEVRCVSLDQLLDRHGIDRIGILKVDIEGGELEVLRSAAGWIDRVDVLVAELHDSFRPGCTRAFVAATHDFEQEFVRGENTFALRTAIPSAGGP